MFEVLVATVIIKENKVLMVKEQKEEVRGLLNLPAGHLEINETLTQGAIREVKEETGLNAKITSFIDTQYFSRNQKHYVVFVFQGEVEEDLTKFDNELEFEFYDMEYLRGNVNLLRNDKLILSAIDKINSGNKEAIDILR